MAEKKAKDKMIKPKSSGKQLNISIPINSEEQKSPSSQDLNFDQQLGDDGRQNKP